jgi:excinuclease ABC subunit C
MSVKLAEYVLDKLKGIPSEPGVYIMEDQSGDVLYVGKGRDLKSRVKSYFLASRPIHPRVDAMVSKIRDIRWVVTDSEVEALVLESSLIKEYSPRYNVNLKDDKRYPYIKITLNEEYPRILVTRVLEDDGARYFGPYTAVKKMRRSLNLIKKIFPVRSCHYDLVDENPERVCLDFHIGKCLGPCHDHQTREEYRKIIREVILFLSGKNSRVIKDLEKDMDRAVNRMEYESAARYRDQIDCMKAVQERQKVVYVKSCDQDLVSLYREGTEVCGLVMKIREGRLLGSRHLHLVNADWQKDAEILSLFLMQFYQTEQDVAGEILLPYECEDLSLLREWFAGRGKKIPKFSVPLRGEKRKLLDLAMKNCRLVMAELKMLDKSYAKPAPSSLTELQRILRLKIVPRKIVCLDISEFQGSDAVGSLVRFDDGRPCKSEYRRFKVRSIKAQNDVAMMVEVLERYLLRKTEADDLPDLIILDGGKGQLSACTAILDRYSLGDIPIFALAKKNEDLYGPDFSEPVKISRDSPALHLLCRLRDEAHRFAVGYHRTIRSKRYRASALDSIPGIGEVRKRNLLRAFGSVQKIRAASAEDINRVEGFSKFLSERVKTYLHN